MTEAVETFETILDNSDCERSDWKGAVVPFFKTFGNAGLVLGAGTPEVASAFSYDVFIALGF